MKKTIISLILILTMLPLSAQQISHPYYKQTLSLSWQNHYAFGEYGNFIDKYSLGGFDFNYTYYFDNSMGIGISFAWNYGEQFVPSKVVRPAENIAIKAAGTKYTEAIPIKAQYKYMITPRSFVKFYVAAGMGAIYNKQELHVQDYAMYNGSWAFLLNPEIGVMIPFGINSVWGLNINAGYNWATNDFQNIYANFGLYIAFF